MIPTRSRLTKGETFTVTITYKTDATDVDWPAMRQIIRDDNFHNGRSVEQYRRSFENSDAVVIAYDDDAIIGTARMLSDGVCNAYIVDVWTLSAYRGQGIASHMMELLEAQAQGQHISLWTDTAEGFYERLGYQRTNDTLFEKIVGEWLQSDLGNSRRVHGSLTVVASTTYRFLPMGPNLQFDLNTCIIPSRYFYR